MTGKEIQEWLSLHGYKVAIDGVVGPVTSEALRKFMQLHGIVSDAPLVGVYSSLVAPLTRALRPIPSGITTLPAAIVAVARQHLAEAPREVGGENCGPWVRYYTEGYEGVDYPWCAGFVSRVIAQAERSVHVQSLRIDSLSCDDLANRAKALSRFNSDKAKVKPGNVFLVRGKVPGDWIHCGIVIEAGDVSVRTIEGNTNDEGHREGYEVCERIRGYSNLDFISI